MISAPGLARSALRLAGFHGVTMWVSASAPSHGGLEGAETDCEEWVRDTAGGADLAPDWGSGCGWGGGGRTSWTSGPQPLARAGRTPRCYLHIIDLTVTGLNGVQVPGNKQGFECEKVTFTGKSRFRTGST